MPEFPLGDMRRCYSRHDPADFERICATPRAVVGAWATLLLIAMTAAVALGAVHEMYSPAAEPAVARAEAANSP